MQLGTIFTLNEYEEAYKFVSENGYTIEEIESDGERQFKIVEVSTPDLSYSEKRALEYPSIQDQLDMLYWDKVNGTNNWQETIADIKAKYPKEVEEENYPYPASTEPAKGSDNTVVELAEGSEDVVELYSMEI